MQPKSGIGAALAVVVVYKRPWREVQSAELLEAALLGGRGSEGGALPRLGRLLIYDNSPAPMGRPAAVLTNCDYVHDGSNGGTRAAYARGRELAQSRQFSWLVLLDHDTTLSVEYFDELHRALTRLDSWSRLQTEFQSDSHPHFRSLPRVESQPQPDPQPQPQSHSRPRSLARPVGLLFPRVIGESELGKSGVLSPVVINRWGTIKPVDAAVHLPANGALTAVASGSAVRVDALAAVGTIPATLWLDYLDHWLFLHVQKLGYGAECLSATIRHDLSIRSAAPPSLERLTNILSAERLFTRTLGLGARIAYPFRLLLRAIRMLPSDRGAARLMLQQLVTADTQRG
jgi:GT2 family glycosyltransferase